MFPVLNIVRHSSVKPQWLAYNPQQDPCLSLVSKGCHTAGRSEARGFLHH